MGRTVLLSRPTDPLASLPGVHDLHTIVGQVRFEVDGDHIDAIIGP